MRKLFRRPTSRGLSSEEIKALVDSVPFWWHSIDLGSGIVTPGSNSLELLRSQWDTFCIPDVRNKTVLDVGAWDGFFSFEAERRGAVRVVALDHYVWSLDLDGQQAYWRRCREQGRDPKPYHETEYWKPQTLPGKRGFDVAKKVLGSDVDDAVADFASIEPGELGTFDVVLFLGVLYHLEDPFGALKRLAMMTNEVAVIHTEAISVRDLEDVPLLRFFPGAELNHDVSNWWAPNLVALTAMCKTAGFHNVEPVDRPDRLTDSDEPLVRYRVTVHASRQRADE